jgi:hypothetical protein
MRPNPRTTDHPEGSDIRVAQERFNTTYCLLLKQLEEACNGDPARLGDTVGTMYQVKAQAQALMTMPLEDGTVTAGPTFEYVPPGLRNLTGRRSAPGGRTGAASWRCGQRVMLWSVGTTFAMVPSGLNRRRSTVTSRCVPSPPGMANRW